MGKSVRIGVVLPQTGRLAGLSDPLTFCGQRLTAPLGAAAGTGRRVELVWRDSRSDPAAATEAVRELAADPQVVLVLTMAGTRMVPAIAEACQSAGIPCLSTALPWQVYRGSLPPADLAFRWGFHFCWGLGDIGRVFAELWRLSGATSGPSPGSLPRVGCLWNDNRQGDFLRRQDDPTGFLAAANAGGFPVYDPGSYREDTHDFSTQIEQLRSAGVTVVTSAATSQDLGRFRTQATASGWIPTLITCSRWLAYPSGVHPQDTLPTPNAATGVATLVYWTPQHPYTSSLDATTPRALAHDYQHHTGKSWLQPLGLAHALLEVAAHALSVCNNPTDRVAIADTLAGSYMDTLVGRLDWAAGPAAGIAGVHLVGGQWQDHNGIRRLATVTNTGLSQLVIDGHLSMY
jgi:branched-chain amino acid transport system substrate-binding protein